MLAVLSVLSAALGVVVWLMAMVLFLACGANSTPRQILELKILLWVVGVCGLAALAGSFWAFVVGRYGWSAALGAVPIGVSIAAVVWLMWSGSPPKMDEPWG